MPDDPRLAAEQLFRDGIIWDDHAGFGPDPGVDLGKLQIWKDAGVHYLSINVGYDVMDWRDSVKSLAAFRRWILATDGYQLVASVDEVRQARKAGNLAVTFDLEGMNALDGSLDMVEMYYHLGRAPDACRLQQEQSRRRRLPRRGYRVDRFRPVRDR